MEYSPSASETSTSLTESPAKPPHENSFGSKLRAAALFTLSAIPALFGSSCSESTPYYGGSTTVEGSTSKAPARSTSEIQNSVKITDEIATSDGSRVNPNPNGTYGHGYIVGSPINSGYIGPIYQTYELHINQGYFPDDLSYIGSDVHLSIDERDQEIFERFQGVEKESHQQYVFEYSRKHPLNPEIEDSSIFLQNVYPLGEFLEHLDVKDLPKEIRSEQPWAGSSGIKTKVGRIVDIERYGQLGDFCILEINMSGLSGAQGGEKVVKLTVVDEDIAAWCEKAMALGRDVEIDVAQDFWEVWEPSSMVVTGIRFKDTAPRTAGPTHQQHELTDEQYEFVRERLSRDPVFIESIKAQLDDSGK